MVIKVDTGKFEEIVVDDGSTYLKIADKYYVQSTEGFLLTSWTEKVFNERFQYDKFMKVKDWNTDIKTFLIERNEVLYEENIRLLKENISLKEEKWS